MKLIPGDHRKAFLLPERRVYHGQGMVRFNIINAGQSKHFLELRGFNDYWERLGR